MGSETGGMKVLKGVRVWQRHIAKKD